MKKIIALGLLLMSAMVFVPSASAQIYQQDRWETQRQDGYNRQRRDRRRYDNRRYDNRRYDYYRTYTVMEYRYIRVGRRVYRETYRSTYRRNGMLVSRILVSRERMYRYEGYRGRDYRDDGIRFNIFLRF